jgi:small RNA 2'-O-methyltransferase
MSDFENLQEERLNTVLDQVLSLDAGSVLDLGCGPGEFLSLLCDHVRFQRIVGVDSSAAVINEARGRLGRHASGPEPRIRLIQASFLEAHEEMKGFDVATLIEAIEHVPPESLSLLERHVFGYCRPKSIIITTPNSEYNRIYGIPANRFRHPGHRFEWSRAKFQGWASGIATRAGYTVSFHGIGSFDPVHGSPTQMAKFIS